jgi:putative ABC transport system permease protein
MAPGCLNGCRAFLRLHTWNNGFVMIEAILVEGLIYGIMVLGVFITFRVLDFPDLTVDGTFPLGAALMVQGILLGMNGWLALLCAFIGGVLAGIVTALIHNHLKVPNLLAGILTMTMLYSINIRILGNRANVPVLDQKTLLKDVTGQLSGSVPEEYILLVFFVAVSLVIKLLIDLFFRTDLGMTIGAMGNNEQMIVSQGINPKTLKTIGLGLSNGLVAVSGAFAAQYLGFADVGLGQGIIISGLASVMIGEFLIMKSNRIGVLTLCALAGSVLFHAVMYLGRYYGYLIKMTPNDLNLIKGLLIIILLIMTQARKFNLATFKAMVQK